MAGVEQASQAVVPQMGGRVAGARALAMNTLRGAGSLAMKGGSAYGRLLKKAPVATGLATIGAGVGAYAGFKSINPGYAPGIDPTQAQQIQNQQLRGQGVDEATGEPNLSQGFAAPQSQAQQTFQERKGRNPSLTYQDYEKERFRLLKEQGKIQDQMAFNEIYQSALN